MSSELTSLEKRLRAARPEAPGLPPDFAPGVMEAIEAGSLTVRPAWRGNLLHWARLASGATVLLAGAVLVNAAVFDLWVSGGLELMNFGLRFLDGFIASLSWDLIFGALAAGLAAGFLLRTGKTARVRLAWVLMVSYGVSVGGGAALAGSGVNQVFHDRVEQGERLPPLMQWFYATRARYRRPHAGFRIGKVISVDHGRALLRTPLGEEVAVILPPGFKTAPGEHLRLAGTQHRTGFRTAEAQRCQAESVRPYFHHARMMRRGGMHGTGKMPAMGSPEMRERMRQMMPGGKEMMRDGMMKGGGMMPGGMMEETPSPRPGEKIPEK